MTIANREQANQEIARLVSEAYAALEEASAIAIRWETEFSFSPSYGMGGTYYGYPDTGGWNDRTEPGWVSSSNEC